MFFDIMTKSYHGSLLWLAAGRAKRHDIIAFALEHSSGPSLGHTFVNCNAVGSVRAVSVALVEWPLGRAGTRCHPLTRSLAH